MATSGTQAVAGAAGRLRGRPGSRRRLKRYDASVRAADPTRRTWRHGDGRHSGLTESERRRAHKTPLTVMPLSVTPEPDLICLPKRPD